LGPAGWGIRLIAFPHLKTNNPVYNIIASNEKMQRFVMRFLGIPSAISTIIAVFVGILIGIALTFAVITLI
jgi:hypothetical protein